MLADDTKNQIQQAYRDFLAGRGIRARYGQRLMIAEIAKYVSAIEANDGERTSPPSACVIEAGTGTGKTLAYLLAMIPLARQLGKKLVISTATVALQDQIVGRDLPDLKQHSKLNFSWTLAKGRGRYLCLSRLESKLHEHGQGDSETMPLFLLEEPSAEAGDNRQFMEELLASYASREWDGDRDHWPGGIPDDTWRQVTTDHRQCTNRHCGYFDSCAFFAARGYQENADVIVANHDLVLADLTLGGGAILPRPEETLYVFDEAHHLPDKALSHFAASLSLQGTRQWLKQLSQVLARIVPFVPPGTGPAKVVENIGAAARELDPLLDGAYQHLVTETPWSEDDREDAGHYRFPQGQIDPGFKAIVDTCVITSTTLVRHLNSLLEELEKGFDDRKESDLDRSTAEAWYPAIGTLQNRAEGGLRLWQSFAAKDEGQGPPMARWLQREFWESGDDITLYSSPVLADNLLYTRLWSRAFGVVLTSATLTALGRFDRLRQRAGLPEESQYVVVPSAFRYAEMATVEVPANAVDPSDAAAFTDSLVKALPDIWRDEQAVLVLFTSRRQMHDVRDLLAPQFPDLIVTQDDMSKAAVLAHHRERIDRGDTSILFGVASFAEGIDLPGAYLRHVIITRLPFSVPNDPIEASLAEWITVRGGNPFMEISVPDASIRLIQAAGRLLRTEDDRGRITILDRRIVSRRYGRLLLDALPPFRRVLA